MNGRIKTMTAAATAMDPTPHRQKIALFLMLLFLLG
jgi:hypothetical protein